MSKKAALCCLTLLTLVLCPIGVWAQEEIAKTPVPAPPTVPNKNDYTIFNPTPDTQMRSFCTDRPTKSNLPCTVDAGRFQYEADAVNWGYTHQGDVTRNTYLFTNPTFKLGLTNNWDVELNIIPFEEIVTHDKSTHQTTYQNGNGDLYLRFKYNLIGNDKGDFIATLLPYVKVPTAEPGIGNKAFEGGMIVPVSFNLPKGYVLLFDPEIDELKNANDNGTHTNYQGLVNLSHTLFTDTISYNAEIWTDSNRDPSGTVAEASVDLALLWLMHPNLQFDVGTNIGLNRATPDLQTYAGISQRF